MPFKIRRVVPALVGLAVLAPWIAADVWRPDPFERLQLAVFDALQRAAPWDERSDDEVRVVDIDDASLKRLGQWPWPRSTLAKLTSTLQDLGAKAIAFDMVFSEPDRTSPARLAEHWRESYGWTLPSDGSVKLPDFDEEFARAVARGRVVTGFSLVAEASGSAPDIRAGFATIGGDPAATIANFDGAIPNLAILETAAAGNGAFNIVADHDSTIRRAPLIAAFGGKLVPSIALEALRVALDEDTIAVRAERYSGAGGPVTGYTLRIGAFEAPLDASGGMILHHGRTFAREAISAWRLLDPDRRGELARDIDGRIVLVGTSAVGLSDLRQTPLNPFEPGVNLNARAVEQILSHHFLARPAWARAAERTGAVGLATVLSLLAAFRGPRVTALALAVSLLLVACATLVAFASWGLLFDPSFIVLTALASGVAAIFARYFLVERDASRLETAFAHYLSPTLVAELARDPDRLKLGGEQREMTFLFTDLQGFTSLAEAADPKSLVIWLNGYLDGLCSIAMEHGGTVDKIVGDAVHVMFNAPLDQPDHAERAVRCALAIDAFAQDHSRQLQARGIDFGATRIGVNTGIAVVGNFGGGRRFDYTAHGDAINTAARLESANKTLGTRVCVARATVDEVRSMEFLPIGTLMLKGKSQGVEVFTPASGHSWNASYLAAFARMSDGDETGSAEMAALAERHPDQPILALHARRIRAGERTTRMAA